MSDYDRIAQAIAYLTRHANSQPTLADVAAHLQLSPFHFQRLFCRWVGVTPKRYLQVLTVERAKQLLRESRPLLDVTDAVGLSSGSRLHDHFIHLEAATPGEFKAAGEGMTIGCGLHETPFGPVFIAATARGICGLEFVEGGGIETARTRLARKWPYAHIRENQSQTRALAGALFSGNVSPDRPLSLYVSGTNFQVSVWKALLQIPSGQIASYAGIAKAIGRPRASRAVGGAVGDNPIAFAIPCHRVICQNGDLGGYHWGEIRKHAIHAWEAARQDPLL
ncbi:MAG: bifunctional helix-turn-helix domain-containing protein/methylated-DNA--[protein]-cysteine S-methyltransferase [Betaproteobacteria bacterium]|nr:bifunctional helix-turn-helix domain-containing protein/methylated-DNA--[protein]-cysteine S-methyltransferase [Betaproteobacteria bacterium]MDE2132735.1 bifunctional helix-turn-helix domain-containing protein/methylated-DNA--[protein]-cysteine S-methyltransferase [Betaproteobacteria bacterium]